MVFCRGEEFLFFVFWFWISFLSRGIYVVCWDLWCDFNFGKFDVGDKVEWILISLGKKLWLKVYLLFSLELRFFRGFRIGFVVLGWMGLVIEGIECFFLW